MESEVKQLWTLWADKTLLGMCCTITCPASDVVQLESIPYTSVWQVKKRGQGNKIVLGKTTSTVTTPKNNSTWSEGKTPSLNCLPDLLQCKACKIPTGEEGVNEEFFLLQPGSHLFRPKQQPYLKVLWHMWVLGDSLYLSGESKNNFLVWMRFSKRTKRRLAQLNSSPKLEGFGGLGLRIRAALYTFSKVLHPLTYTHSSEQLIENNKLQKYNLAPRRDSALGGCAGNLVHLFHHRHNHHFWSDAHVILMM